MPSRKIEQQLEQLNALRSGGPSETTVLALRKALGDRVNLVVAKAAAIAGDLECRDLIPDLERAFERFFRKPVETDRQCWAKNALSKALKDLDHAESALFLRGLQHIQMEPVYGDPPYADSAATLRATCALALPQCRDIARLEILQHLVNALTDQAAAVRMDAARAVEQMDGGDAALLLRLKARAGDKEAGVTGQVLDSLLGIEHEAAIPFVAGFLESHDDDTREEAALALGASRLPGAVEVLKEAWTSSRNFRSGEPLLRAIGASRQESGLDFLLQLIRDGSPSDARDAVSALRFHRESSEIARRFREAVEARGGSILEFFSEHFTVGRLA